MPEQLLDDPQVGSTLQEMGRERVAQGVGRDPVAQAGVARRALDHRPGRLPAESMAAAGHEQRPAPRRVAGDERQPGRADLVDVAAEPVEGHLADGHQPLLVALADHPHEAAFEDKVLPVEVERLADPQARCVEQLEQRPIPDPGRA